MPLDVWCTQCGSSDLDVGATPRGDEPVSCRQCGQWFTFAELERAALAKLLRMRGDDAATRDRS
jgi:hypothetical protein